MSYQSKHTGTSIDNAVSAHTQIDNEITTLKSKDTTLQNNINTVSNNVATNATNINSLNNSVNSLNSSVNGLNSTVTTLNNSLNQLKNTYYCEAYYSGSGDTSFTTHVKFNQVVYNQGNCYNSSTGYYTVPEDGFYYAAFTYYSNSATHQRPAIMCTNHHNVMTNSVSAAMGHSVSTVKYLTKGSTICAGAYNSQFPISLYAASGHNEFVVIKIK